MGQDLQLFNLGNAIVASNNAKQATKGGRLFRDPQFPALAAVRPVAGQEKNKLRQSLMALP
jgi:hypothetical protein